MRIGKHYRVTGRFEGGMGVAFRCEDERQQGRVVILKTYKSGSGGDESQLRAAFTREAQVWIALHRQQYLALVEDVLLIDGRIFVEMPYYANGSLRNVLDQGPIPVERAVAFAAQLVLAMIYVSDERKILHLDLKPENILIGSSGEALITDLGLARAMHPAWGTGPAVSSLAAPQDGGVVGTVPYMSPEMIAGRGVNATADIWAWGLIVYEMVMGRRAYEGRDLRSMLKSIVSEPPLQWSKFKAQVPSDLFAVISKCLLKDPAGRFSSFGELASGLDRLIALVDAEEHVPFWNKWKKKTRVRITEPLLKSHWKTRVRPHLEDGTTTRVKQTELMLLTQAQRSRKIGDTKAALLALEKLLGSESEWGKRWACLMLEREDHVFIRQHTSGSRLLLGRSLLTDAAELRLAAFLDTIYDESQNSIDEMVAYLQACVAIMASDHKSPKLAELCGQIYMAKRFFDDAHDAFGWAWQNAKGTSRTSTAACILTLYQKENDMSGLREFAESEVIPVLGGYDDPLAQETCARAHLYLEESKQALRYLRRSLALDHRRPWTLTQACIAAWNSGLADEARQWRRTLIEVEITSKYVAEIDAMFPMMRESALR